MKTFDKYLEKKLENPELLQEWNELEIEYQLREQIIKSRSENQLSQLELAQRCGMKQSSIARMESGRYNPSIRFLQRIAKGLGKKLRISFD